MSWPFTRLWIVTVLSGVTAPKPVTYTGMSMRLATAVTTRACSTAMTAVCSSPAASGAFRSRRLMKMLPKEISGHRDQGENKKCPKQPGGTPARARGRRRSGCCRSPSLWRANWVCRSWRRFFLYGRCFIGGPFLRLGFRGCQNSSGRKRGSRRGQIRRQGRRFFSDHLRRHDFG